jgi:hypothetical protein
VIAFGVICVVPSRPGRGRPPSAAGAGTTGPADGSAEMFGPYRPTSRLGRGGMGAVHRAYDTRRDREVALKRLAPDLADDPEIRERFERECRTAARLSSPHVVPIHDFGDRGRRSLPDLRGLGRRRLLDRGRRPVVRRGRPRGHRARAAAAGVASGLTGLTGPRSRRLGDWVP